MVIPIRAIKEPIASKKPFTRCACDGAGVKIDPQLGVLTAVLCMSLTSCVSLEWKDGHGNIRHWGVLRYSFIDTDTARIFVQEAMGINLRLTSVDPGVSLGYRKYIAAQPRPPGVSVMTTGGYFWVEDQVSGQASLFFKKMWGAELGFSLLSNGLSLGRDTTTLIVGPKAGESVTSKIYFYEGDLHATVLQQRGGQQ